MFHFLSMFGNMDKKLLHFRTVNDFISNERLKETLLKKVLLTQKHRALQSLLCPRKASKANQSV